MMRLLVIPFCCVAFCGVIAAQEAKTNVIVKVPSELKYWNGTPVDQVRVSVNGKIQTIAPGGNLQVDLPASAGDKVVVDLSLITTKLFGIRKDEVTHWSDAINLNGSGHLDYFAGLGHGTFQQWPWVVFQARGPAMDILVDDNIVGTTETGKGVSPDRSHTFVWRRENANVCMKGNVTLPGNVTRVYVCDASTHKVDVN
jgi:hypothetical protein